MTMMIRSKLTAFLLFCVLFVIPIHSRYVEMSVTSQEPALCGTGPCGWAVYNQQTRVIEEFLRHPCICSDGYECVQDYDKTSLSAYIYTCQSTVDDVSDNSIL